VVVDAANEAEVEERLAEDPWEPIGVLQTASVERWDIWLSSGA
jgi:hypothetical protein